MCTPTESDVVDQDIKELVAKICHNQDISNYSIDVIRGAEKGDNYLGQVFAVTVTDKDNNNKLNLFVKLSLTNEKVRDLAPVRDTYENEIRFYNEIYPKLVRLQQEKAVENPVSTIPKCLLTSLIDKKEYIVMENLKLEGFELNPKHLMYTDEQNQKIFNEYGRFHALTFAFQKHEPKPYKNISKELHNIFKGFFTNSNAEAMEQYFKNSLQLAQNSLVDDELYHEKFQYYVDNGVEILKKMSNLWDEPYSTLLHGDCWSNNFLFKYEDTKDRKVLKDMKILDWQLARISPPVLDLAYAFYSGNDGQYLGKYKEYLQIYHNSLTKYLKELGCDAEELYPYKVMMDQWYKYTQFKLLWSISLHQVKLTKADAAFDLADFAEHVEKSDEIMHIVYDEKEFNKRVRDLLIHGFEENVI